MTASNDSFTQNLVDYEIEHLSIEKDFPFRAKTSKKWRQWGYPGDILLAYLTKYLHLTSYNDDYMRLYLNQRI